MKKVGYKNQIKILTGLILVGFAIIIFLGFQDGARGNDCLGNQESLLHCLDLSLGVHQFWE